MRPVTATGSLLQRRLCHMPCLFFFRERRATGHPPLPEVTVQNYSIYRTYNERAEAVGSTSAPWFIYQRGLITSEKPPRAYPLLPCSARAISYVCFSTSSGIHAPTTIGVRRPLTIGISRVSRSPESSRNTR